MAQCGLIGQFPGDDEKRAKLAEMESRLSHGDVPTAAEVLEVLELLPYRGRVAFVRRLVDADAGGEMLWTLFMSCVGGVEGQPGNGTMHSHAKAVITAGRGSQAVRMFREYETRGGRRHRMALLGAAIGDVALGDEELLEAYRNSVVKDRAEVLARAKHGGRGGFLRLLLDAGEVVLVDVVYAVPGLMSGALLAPTATPASQETIWHHGFRNWSAHGDTYIAFLRAELSACGTNALERGRIFRKFERKIHGNVTAPQVLRLAALCKDLQPLEFSEVVSKKKNGTKVKQQQYLAAESLSGRLDLSFPGVRVAMPGTKLLQKLEKKVAFVESLLVTADDGALSIERGYEDTVQSALQLARSSRSRDQLTVLATKCFAHLPEDAFWLHTLRHHRDGDRDVLDPWDAMCTPEIRFFSDLVGLLDFNMNGDHRSTDAVVDAWVALHRRCVPNADTAARLARCVSLKPLPCGVAGEHFLWTQWVGSVGSAFGAPVLASLKEAGRLVVCTDLEGRSGLTAHLGFVSALQDTLVAALELPLAFAAKAEGAPTWEMPATVMHTLSTALLPSIGPQHAVLLHAGSDSPVLSRHRSALCALHTEVMAPLLTGLLGAFSATSELYMKEAALTAWEQFFSFFADERYKALFAHSPAFMEATLETLEGCLSVVHLTQEQKDQRFAVLQHGGVRSFRVYVVGRHGEFVQKTMEVVLMMSTVLHSQEKWRRYEEDTALDALAMRLWTLYKQTEFMQVEEGVVLLEKLQRSWEKEGKKDKYEKKRAQYLRAVGGQRRAVVLAEQGTILKVAQGDECFQQLGTEKLRKVGLLDILYTANPHLSDRLLPWIHCLPSVLEGTNPIATTLTEDAKSSDVLERMKAHCNMVDCASSKLEGVGGNVDLAGFVRVLEDVCRRTRNEASYAREHLQDTLHTHLHLMVRASLCAGTDAEALQATQALHAQILTLVRDNDSKRDSIKGRYLNPEKILRFALAFDNEQTWGRPAKALCRRSDVRRAWVELAVRIEFLAMKNLGEEQCRQVAFPSLPAGFVASLPAWDLASIDARKVAHIAQQHYGQHAAQQTAKLLAATANSPASAGTPYSVIECAEMLTSALDAVKSTTALKDHNFFGLDGVELSTGEVKAVFARVAFLAKICKWQWVNCAQVTDFVDAFVERVKTPAWSTMRMDVREEHAKQGLMLYQLLGKTVPTHFRSASAQLTALCTALLQETVGIASLQKGFRQTAHAAAKMFLSLHSTGTVFEGVSPYELILLAEVGKKALLPLKRRRADFKAGNSEALLSAVSTILDLSPSAVHLDTVRTALICHRDDLLTLFLGRPCADFSGPLQRDTKVPKGVFVLNIEARYLPCLNGACAELYSTLLLKNALRLEASTQERTQAVSDYVMFTSTSGEDIVALLQTLQKDSPAMVEVAVLAAFKTDSAWCVLEYLLRPAVLKGAPQATTAAVLRNLCLWAPPERVTAVLKRLLTEQDSRSAMRMPLFKSVVRELLNSTDTTATGVLLHEWRNRKHNALHKDLQREVVGSCLTQVLDVTSTGKAVPTDDVWEVLAEAADPAQNPEEVQLELLVPRGYQNVWFDAGGDTYRYGVRRVDPTMDHWVENMRSTEFMKRYRQRISESEGYKSCVPRLRYCVDAQDVEDPRYMQQNARTKRVLEFLQHAGTQLAEGAQDEHIRTIAEVGRFQYDWRGWSGHIEVDTLREMEAAFLRRIPDTQDSNVPIDIPDEFVAFKLSRVYTHYVMTCLEKREMCKQTYTPFERSQGLARAHIVQSNPVAQQFMSFSGTIINGLLDTPVRNHVRRHYFRAAAANIIFASMSRGWQKDLISTPHHASLRHMENKNYQEICIER